MSDQEQRTAPRRSEVGVAPEVTWNVGGALQSLGMCLDERKKLLKDETKRYANSSCI